MVCCNVCGEDFSRTDSLTRHRKRKYPCDRKNHPTIYQSDSSASNESRLDNSTTGNVISQDVTARRKDIPTFDGSEFSGEKPTSRKTLFKIMEMLNIPEQRRERIAKDIEEEEEENESGKKLKTPANEKFEPLREAELQEMLEDFQQLYSDLIKKRRRENVPELVDILNIWREVGEIDQDGYDKVSRKIKTI